MKRLAAAGMDTRQAKALAETLPAHAFDSLVTKAKLRAALHELELRLTMRMGAILAASTAISVTIFGALITLS